MKRARTENGKLYDAEVHGVKRRVTVPEDPKDEDVMTDALREDLSPQAIAGIVAYLQPACTKDPDANRQIHWFADELVKLLGGYEQQARLAEELGL